MVRVKLFPLGALGGGGLWCWGWVVCVDSCTRPPFWGSLELCLENGMVDRVGGFCTIVVLRKHGKGSVRREACFSDGSRGRV